MFVYSGNGSQWQGMGRAMLASSVFDAAVAEVDALFQPLAGYSLRAELLGENRVGAHENMSHVKSMSFAPHG